MNTAEVEAKLRAAGCTMTAQRRAILAWLDGNLSHPTASDVFEAITADFPMASRATVYNTLALLEQMGAVAVLHDGAREARYDPNVVFHHHRVCPSCGRIDDIDAGRVEVRLNGAAARGQVRFEERCGACAGDVAQGA